MPSPFLSSEEYDERAHQLYNEGSYDEALTILREGLGLYPNAVELHVGVGYARLARDEFAWARRSFEEALVLDPEHEDALAGLGEVLLRLGQTPQAMKSFRRILELGYADDVELMLQVGRALFRDGLMEEAKEYFDIAVQQTPENAEAVAMVGTELFYFSVFLALVWRFRAAAEGEKRRVLLTFAVLLVGAYAARSLLAGLVLVDVRLSAIALLAVHASNLPPLLYLSAKADRVFAPVRAEQATPLGIEHVLDRHGITKRERQIVEKICLGKTNKQIAEELFISLQTVKDHTHRIYSKIGVNSRVQLVQLMNTAR